MIETWKDVVGYEGIYEVSDYGRVRTKEGKQTHSVRHGVRTWKPRILKEKNPKGRDVRVSLWKDKGDKSFLVHRLVAFAFIPEVPGKTCINHIDGNPRNNHVSNLEWCTYKENTNHAFDHDLQSSNMKVKLINAIGIEYEFRSIARANNFLKRSHSYINDRLKKGYTHVENIEGMSFKVIKL
ncbi:NUMOD4 domain-containing protein [Macrococcus equipercicus]|uniref:NUMOD4 motif-containing HNH endonuclease n=1 Tax=Macrococcus equipercicus TaxID=69967 RepID=A0A9Q9BNE4_9STAP|nr:NUMOD4 domain-containing protein [Macrococcus equipercicus]UTH14748.1 NUMOD4 motif-containing HNH endonuclease [Macrococcus equipercicus]